VTDRWDGPYRYRCREACKQLRNDGAIANVIHLADPDLLAEIPRYGVLVLFRLAWSERVEAVLEVARRSGIAVLFDIDDLAFDPSVDELMPFRKRYSAGEWASTYGRQMVGLRKTLVACDAFIGSTAELAERAERLGKRAHVHPNVVPDYYLRAGRISVEIRGTFRRDPTIGYFSGSDTHDEDFSSIVPALDHVLSRLPHARILVCGHLQVPGGHARVERRIVRLPYMHWREFALAYAACHVTVAPLSVKNAFTNSKSALKFFEAGAFYTPTVASPVREMASAIMHDENGWLAETESDWAELMIRALEASASERVGGAARRSVESAHSSHAVRGRLRALLQTYASSPGGREPTLRPTDPPDESGDDGPVRKLLRPASAARNALRIALASRQRLGRFVDLEVLDRLVDAVGASASVRAVASVSGVEIVALSDFSAWLPNDQIAPYGQVPGERKSVGQDPFLTSPKLDIDPSRYRYLVLRMRARTQSGRARAQVYWTATGGSTFSETSSSTAVVVADGFDRTYVFDWPGRPTGIALGGKVPFVFRIDPLDGPGSFRLSALLLLPDEGKLRALESAWPLLHEQASDPPVVGAADLPRVAAALAPAEVTRVFLRGDPDAVRLELAQSLRSLDTEAVGLTRSDGGVAADLVRSRRDVRAGVDIVIPVYNARELVERCLRSVLRHATGDFRVVVVDDASTDPELRSFLARTAEADSNVRILSNSKNVGFLGSANRGIRAAEGRDVLLLNSDTEVFEGFLEGLVECAYSHDRIGLVSPLSNNATILSVPEFCRPNLLPEAVSAREVAAVVRDSSKRRRPDIVTPHGFCLYLKSRFLADVGSFDAEHFGRGFGEENDLGERAKRAGWRIVAADDVYVWHAGKASFGDEGRILEKKNGEVLERLHPGYHADVAEFVRKNPLSEAQAIVRRNLHRRSFRVAPAPLLILHEDPFSESPGGVEYSVRDLVRAMALPRVVLLHPGSESIDVLEIIDGNLDERLVYRFPLGRLPERFCHSHDETARIVDEVLSLFHVGWVHIHHLMFLPLDLPQVVRARGLPYVVTVHDFYFACPSFNLLDVRTTTACCPASCGDASRTADCQRALFRTLGDPLPDDLNAYVGRHRKLGAEALGHARAVVFPSPSAERIASTVLGLDRARNLVVPHGYDVSGAPSRCVDSNGPLRVGIVGQLAYASKGAEAYLSVIERLGEEAVEWHLFGRTDLFDFERRLAARAPKARIVRHGAYERHSVVSLLVEAGVDVGLLLPAWPETFSYTLSELAGAGVPVVASRIGALADRLAGEPWARLVDDPVGAAAALATMARDRALLSEMTKAVRRPEGTKDWASRFTKMYAECAADSPVHGSRATTPLEHERLNEVAAPRTTRVVSPVSVTEPAPSVASSPWYRYAERVNPYLPESVRSFARRKLSPYSSRDVLRFRLPGPKAKIGDGLSLHQRYLTTTRLTSHGTDPYILLELDPLDPRDVDSVRFNLWCSTPRHAFAQLYWRHEGRVTFDEEHSMVVPLEGKMDAWQEYVVRFDGTRPCRAWYEGGSVVELRFDPINLPGPIGLGELVLCRRERAE
jgi:GT2 family glycosyltransferase/glycosyltransferase involved in cell wall biosynthesis